MINPIPTARETKAHGMEVVWKAAGKYRGWEPEGIPGTYIQSWIQAQVTLEGMKLAIEKVGLENLSGRVVRDALASIKDFDNGIVPPITMSDERPYYCDRFRIYQVQQGSIVPHTDWFKEVPMEFD